MMPFFGLYTSRKPNLNMSERITMACADLDGLLNKLDPHNIIVQHLLSLKLSLFHSHTKVVQLAVKQFIRLATDKLLAEQLSEDIEVVMGMIENLAHKEQRVARDCVMVLLLLSSSPKALMHVLCPDNTNVIKTIMTYVAVRLLVYEFIMQLSINSPLGLEKSHTCGILEDVINDFKKKESYLTSVHYHQLYTLANTTHGRSYLVKYDALDCVSKQPPNVPKESMNHLITVIPTDFTVTATVPDKLQQITDSPASIEDFNEPSSSHFDKSLPSVKEVQLSSSSSSFSSPSDSLDSSIVSRKHDDIKDIIVSDSSSQADRSFTPPLLSSTTHTNSNQEQSTSV